MKELPADGSFEKLCEDNCENTCRQNIDEPEIEKRTVYKWGFLHLSWIFAEPLMISQARSIKDIIIGDGSKNKIPDECGIEVWFNYKFPWNSSIDQEMSS